MCVLIWKLAMQALGAAALFFEPVERLAIRVGVRLAHWRDQAEISWLLALAHKKVDAGRRLRAPTPTPTNVRPFKPRTGAKP